MTSSVLLASLRRSAGLYAFPLFLALEVVNATSRDREWASEWLWTSSASNGILVLLGPLAAGVAAAESVQLRRKGSHALIAAEGVHAARFHVVRVLALAAWACIGHLAGVLSMWVVAMARHGQWGSLQPEVILPSFVLLIAFVCTGAAVGWWLPAIVTPPLVAVAGYILPGLGFVNPSLFLVGGATGSLLGLEYRPSVLLSLSAWWALVAFTALVTLGRAGVVRLAAALTLFGTVVATTIPLLNQSPDELRLATHLPALSCQGRAPQICVSAEVPESLEPVAGVARPLSVALHDLLSDVKIDRIVTVQAAHLPAGTVVVPAKTNEPYVSDLAVASGLVRSVTGCWRGDDTTYAATQMVARYLVAQTGGTVPGPPVEALDRSRARVLVQHLRARCGG